VTYAHDFQSSVTGPITLPFLGPVHGSVRTASTADLVFAGASVAF
jgi:hypothetical protein